MCVDVQLMERSLLSIYYVYLIMIANNVQSLKSERHQIQKQFNYFYGYDLCPLN